MLSTTAAPAITLYVESVRLPFRFLVETGRYTPFNTGRLCIHPVIWVVTYSPFC